METFDAVETLMQTSVQMGVATSGGSNRLLRDPSTNWRMNKSGWLQAEPAAATPSGDQHTGGAGPAENGDGADGNGHADGNGAVDGGNGGSPAGAA